MANPQTENGYTKIANEILDAFLKYEFPPKTSLPQRIFFFVIRKTYGYHKKEDIISLTQFQKGVNEKNRTNMVYWLNYLVQAKILVKNKLPNSSIKWGINKDFEQWLPLVQVRLLVQVRSWGSASTDTKTSASTDTHKRKKENIQKKYTAANAALEKTSKEKKPSFTCLQDFLNSPQAHIKLIGQFFSAKGMQFDTPAEWTAAGKRWMRVSTQIAKFEEPRILEAVSQASAWPEWTLETVLKKLTGQVTTI